MEPNEKRPSGLLECYELIDNNTEKRVGGASLVYTCDEYVIKTVAIEKAYQGKGLGTVCKDYHARCKMNEGQREFI